jgi:hypothetical protein
LKGENREEKAERRKQREKRDGEVIYYPFCKKISSSIEGFRLTNGCLAIDKNKNYSKNTHYFLTEE